MVMTQVETQSAAHPGLRKHFLCNLETKEVFTGLAGKVRALTICYRRSCRFSELNLRQVEFRDSSRPTLRSSSPSRLPAIRITTCAESWRRGHYSTPSFSHELPIYCDPTMPIISSLAENDMRQPR